MEAFNLGLQLSGFGILITFLALGLLILVMVLLQAVFPARMQEEEITAERPIQEDEEDPHTQIAVLTAAWWYWQKKRSSSLGKRLENGPGKRWRKKDEA